MEYNASRHCGGVDAWTCLTRRAEDGLGYDAGIANGGGSGGGGLGDRSDVEETRLRTTMLRCVFCVRFWEDSVGLLLPVGSCFAVGVCFAWVSLWNCGGGARGGGEREKSGEETTKDGRKKNGK